MGKNTKRSLVFFSISILILIFILYIPVKNVSNYIEKQKLIKRNQEVIESNIQYYKEKYGYLSSTYGVSKEFFNEVVSGNTVFKVIKKGNINYICLIYKNIDASKQGSDMANYVVAHNEYDINKIIKSLKYTGLAKEDEIYSIVYYNKVGNKLNPNLIVNYNGSTINNLSDELTSFVRTRAFDNADEILISEGFASSLLSGTYKANTYRFLTYKEKFSGIDYELKIK